MARGEFEIMYLLYGDYLHENSSILCAFRDIPTVEVVRRRLELYGRDNWPEPPDMSDTVLQKLLDTYMTALKWKYTTYWLYLEKVEVV